MDVLASPDVAPFTGALGGLLGLMLAEVLIGFFRYSMLGWRLGAPRTPRAAGGASVVGLLGLDRAPVVVWAALVLAGFGFVGLVVQIVSLDGGGAATPWPLVSLIAAPAGVLVARGLGPLIAGMLPALRSSAAAAEDSGGRPGVITGDEGWRGRPTEARITDARGRTHYLTVEPLEDDAVLTTGQPVFVLRLAVRGVYRATAHDPAAAAPAAEAENAG